MYVLDTNRLRELALKSPLGVRLQGRIERSTNDVVTSVLCAEEVQRGWLARIAAARRAAEESQAYAQFGESIHFLATFVLVPWDVDAATRLQAFRQQRIRIGTMDLKIVCICLEYDGTLLTRNTQDFAQVPGLRIENWLD